MRMGQPDGITEPDPRSCILRPISGLAETT
jgi:hypothetical protein